MLNRAVTCQYLAVSVLLKVLDITEKEYLPAHIIWVYANKQLQQLFTHTIKRLIDAEKLTVHTVYLCEI